MLTGITGLIKLVEVGYQESNNQEKLAFLNLITGNMKSLETLKEAAKKSSNVGAQFNISLYQGDIQGRIKSLIDMGQLALAYQSAVNHGLDEIASAIKKSLPQDVKYSKKSVALIPPKPLIKDYDQACESTPSLP